MSTPERQHDAPDDAAVAHLCASGTLIEVDVALRACVEAKLRIQAQLSQSKSDMLQVRSDLISRGQNERKAQVNATASTDVEWRGRATRAAMAIDGRIVKLKERRRALLIGTKEKTRLAVAVRDKTLEQLAEFVQSWLDDGWSLMQSVQHPEGLVLVLRFDGPLAAAR